MWPTGGCVAQSWFGSLKTLGTLTTSNDIQNACLTSHQRIHGVIITPLLRQKDCDIVQCHMNSSVGHSEQVMVPNIQSTPISSSTSIFCVESIFLSTRCWWVMIDRRSAVSVTHNCYFFQICFISIDTSLCFVDHAKLDKCLKFLVSVITDNSSFRSTVCPS